MRILIVEDEKKAAANLRQGLQESGYVVDVAEDGELGSYLARTGGYDLVILDVMLPGVDGWSIMEQLQRERPDAHVLFLTARDGIADRVKGLDLGADDYLVKPFAFSELLARVRSILRRGSGREVSVARVSDLEVDLIRHRARRGGSAIELTAKEFRLLALLLRRSGEVLSRPIIAEQVWGMDFSCDSNVVDVHVRRLRRKIDDPFEHKLIHTVRGIGYVLEDRA